MRKNREMGCVRREIKTYFGFELMVCKFRWTKRIRDIMGSKSLLAPGWCTGYVGTIKKPDWKLICLAIELFHRRSVNPVEIDCNDEITFSNGYIENQIKSKSLYFGYIGFDHNHARDKGKEQDLAYAWQSCFEMVKGFIELAKGYKPKPKRLIQFLEAKINDDRRFWKDEMGREGGSGRGESIMREIDILEEALGKIKTGVKLVS